MDDYMRDKYKNLKEFRNYIVLMKKDIDDIIDKLENIKNNIDIFYNINEIILNEYESLKNNYYILKNIFNNSFDDSLNQIKEIVKEKDLLKKCDKLFNLYDDINDVHQIRIQYNINLKRSKSELILSSTKTFGDNFVFNNKDICKVIIGNSNIRDLENSYFLAEGNEEIILTNIHKITNMSCMFEECHDLKYADDMSKWNTKNITDMSKMFYYCTSLIQIPDVSKWNTKKVKNLSCFMAGNKCVSIPDFSKWDTSSVENMSYIFTDCINIDCVNGIENWDTSNVTNLSHIFQNCSSLNTIPDIGKWNTSKVTDFSFIFSGCKRLKTIPESIKSWNTDNAVFFGYFINGCERLEIRNLPEIIKGWKLEKVEDKEKILEGCPKCIDINSFKNLNSRNNQSIEELNEKNCTIF